MKQQLHIYKILGSICLFLFFSVASLSGQAVGDYRSKNTSGTWATVGDWERYSGTTWETATAVPGSGNNVTIQTGHTMNFTATANCANLKVEATANLTGASGIGLSVYGTTAEIIGTLTLSGSNGIFQARSSTGSNTVRITGSGSISLARMRPGENDVTLEIDANITLTNTGGYVINANGKSNFTLKINAGKTVTCPSGGYVALGTSGTNDGAAPNATFDIAGTLTIPASTNLSIANATGNTSTLIIRNGGIVNVGGTLNLPSTSAATAMNLRLESGASLSAGTYAVSGATVEYFGSAPMNSLSGLTPIKNLTINNSAGVTLSAATTVTNSLTFTTGKLSLGANNLTITAGSIAGASSSNYIVTNGVGGLILPIPAAAVTTNFPIGTATTLRTVSINYTSAPTAGTLQGRFVASTPGVAGLPITEGGATIETVSPTGYWEMLSGPSDGIYTISVDASGFTKTDGSTMIPSLAGLRLIKRPTNGSWASSTTTTNTNPSALSNITSAGLTGFSDFALGGPASVLPITLVSFSATPNGASNLLTWKTASEQNNSRFDVERSPDGISFTTLGTLKGNETTNIPQTYQFSDYTPLNISYYRLRQIDFSGISTLSKLIAVSRSEKAGLNKIYPSVTTDFLNLEIQGEGQVTLNLVNILGGIVLSKTLNSQDNTTSHRLDVSHLPSGVYVLLWQSGNSSGTQRFEKL